MAGRSRIRWVERRTIGGVTRYRARRQFAGRVHVGPLRATVDEAVADALALTRAIEREGLVGLTLGRALDLREGWLRVHRAPATVEWFKLKAGILRRHMGADTPCTAITRERVQRMIEQRLAERPPDLGPRTKRGRPRRPRHATTATVRHDLRALHQTLRHAVDLGLLQANPMDGYRMPRARSPVRHVLTPEEVAEIAARIDPEEPAFADAVRILFLTGLRRAEFLRVTAGDVDAAHGVLHVRGKTGDRDVPLTREALAVVQRMLGRTHGQGLAVDRPRWLESQFARWKHRLRDPRLHAHALRHSFASALARAGVSPHHLARLLGHRTLQQTMVYVHAHGPDLRVAIDHLHLSGTPGSAAAGPPDASPATHPVRDGGP